MKKRDGPVARVVAVLDAVIDSRGPLTAKDVAETLDLPLSTAHRLLGMLKEYHIVERNNASKRYELTADFLFRVRDAFDRRGLPDRGNTVLKTLCVATGETAVLAKLSADLRSLRFVAKADSEHPLRYRIELFQQQTLLWGATGHAILAFLDQEAQKAIIDMADPSPATGEPLDRDRLLDALEKVRVDGIALSFGERLEGAVGLAAPLFDVDRVTGCIAITIPAARFNPNSISYFTEQVKSAAKQLSRH